MASNSSGTIFKGHAYESEDDQLEFVSVIENMIRELFLCDELVCTSMTAKSSYSMKGEEIHSYGIIVESTNTFMTNIRYRFKNVCFNCYDAFSSLKELKDHKRQYHSY